jgi:hypothetical protein
VKDIVFATGQVTVSRAVICLTRKNHPEGRRFLVKQYPKDREWRQFRLSGQITRKIAAHAQAYGLGPEDLLFARRGGLGPRRAEPEPLPDQEALGYLVAETGRRYRHGTTSAYGLGKCRCGHCKRAVADYRAKRRSEGKDRPAKEPQRDLDPHLNRGTFRTGVLQPALKKAKLEGVTM